MSDPIVIGLDLGTSACKAVALNQAGNIVARSERDYPLESPVAGAAEQDPEAVWQGAEAALAELARYLSGYKIRGVCVSGAMHSVFPVDNENHPLAPALTWADTRAGIQSQGLRKQWQQVTPYQRTGCPLQYLYHPAKIRWFLEEHPELTARTARFVALKDWVIYQLTGRWVTDTSLASSTGLMDIFSFGWDSKALEIAGIGSGQLCPLESPVDVAGELRSQSRSLMGLFQGVAVITGAGDGGLANLGSGALAAGQGVITVGTSGAIRRIVNRPWLDPAERTWCYALMEGHWFAGGAINNAGLAVNWVRRQFYPDVSEDKGFEMLFADADKIMPGSEGVFFLPYLSGERNPYWDPGMRACLSGLGLQHDRRHIARAVLEGVAFCLADVWEALSGLDAPDGRLHLTGGITRSPGWAQIVSDVLGQPLALTKTSDASAVGAAMLGLWALGLVDSLEVLTAKIPAGLIIYPDMKHHSVYIKLHQEFQNLYRSLH